MHHNKTESVLPFENEISLFPERTEPNPERLRMTPNDSELYLSSQYSNILGLRYTPFVSDFPDMVR